jgi:lysozyme
MSMQVSDQGLALIRQFEGFSPLPYRCPAGRLTVGYGHVIATDEAYNGINLAQGEDMLKEDVNIVMSGIANLVRIPLEQCQFDALVALAYNIGLQAFERSTLLRLLNANDLKNAAGQFGRWVYAGGQRMEGLVRRRAAETALFRGKGDF